MTFFTVSDSRFFAGVVVLINSLRLQGHDEPVVVADLGLTAGQRERLATVARVVQLPAEANGNPTLYKAFAHSMAPSGVVVIIDSDMIVTEPLTDVVASARAGQICLFTDATQPQRWFPEWQEHFALEAPLRRDVYLNAGFLAFDTGHWPDLLGRWWRACMAVPVGQTRAEGAPWESPFCDADQDALNALLMSEVPRRALTLRPQYVADVLRRVEVLDVTTLRCSHAGAPAALLHHTGGPKPWQAEAWMRVRCNAYVRLLPRLLLHDDVALRLSPQELPIWLRPGPRGHAMLRLLDAQNAIVRSVVRRTPSGVHRRLRTLRARLAHGHA